MNRWELEQKIVLKALKDPVFKKKLLSQPRETLRDFLKSEKMIDLSSLDKLNIRVVEEKKEEWVLALPSVTTDTSTLTDAEIEKVAGGAGHHHVLKETK